MTRIDRLQSRLAALERRIGLDRSREERELDGMTDEQLHAEIDRLAILENELHAELGRPLKPFKPAAKMTIEELASNIKQREQELGEEEDVA